MKDLKMYINGQFVESKSGKWIDVLNPSTEEVISRQPAATIEEADEAIEAAKAAQKAWAKTPAIERAAYLKKMADGIRRRQDEFVDIIMREQFSDGESRYSRHKYHHNTAIYTRKGERNDDFPKAYPSIGS